MSAACAAIWIWAWPTLAGAQTTFLYNGSGTQTPQSQGWLAFADNAVLGDGTPAVSSSGGTTTLDTTTGNIPSGSSNIEAGYSNYTALGSLVNPAFPSLNPATGFSVSFAVQLNSETHGADDNRAGFDVIVLGSDKKGVELGFWTNDIWAQQLNSNVFTRDPSEDYNVLNPSGPSLSTTSMTDYTLSILSGTYSLYADVPAATPTLVLTSSTHDYSSYTGAGPYSLTNYVFIGDDTTDAEASETFSYLSVTVPEPAAAGALIVLGSAALARRRRGAQSADGSRSASA